MNRRLVLVRHRAAGVAGGVGSLLLVVSLVVAGPVAPAGTGSPRVDGSGVECPEQVARDPAPAMAPDEAAALALAAACQRPVEVVAARGYGERTWAQPAGSLRSEAYAVPRWTRDTGGDWVDVDTTLVAGEDGSVRAAAVIGQVALSGGDAGPLVRFTDPQGRSLSLSWPDMLPEPELAGDTATYPGVLPDVDLTVTAAVDGFSYALVVRTPEAAANPALAQIEMRVDTDGIGVSAGDDGRLRAVTADGKVVFTSGPALMWDRPVGRADGAVQPSPGRMEQMDVRLDGDTLVVVPDAGMLADAAAGRGVELPIVIDPDFRSVGERNWATVHKQQPNRGWTNDSAWPRAGGMRVGLCTWTTPVHCADAWGLWRSVVRFDIEPLDGRHVLDAAVKLTQTHTGGCGTYPLKLNRVSAFTNGVSWNDVNWSSHLQTRNVASSNGGCGSGNQPVSFHNSEVDAAVRGAVDNGYHSISFGLRSGDEGTRNQWRRISRSSLKLEVEHASYPEKPGNTSTDGQGCDTSAPGPWLSTGRPVLSMRPRNDDGNGRYRLRVRTSGGSSDVYTYRSGVVTVNTTVSHRVSSSGALADGSYRWQARTESADSGVPASSYSFWCYFQVDTTPPPEPQASQLTAEPQLGDPVQFELAGSPDTDRFRYHLSGGPSTTVDASGGGATITVDPPDSSIDHALQVWALDAAGNESQRHDRWFTTGKDLSKVPVAGVWRFDGDWRDDSGHRHGLVPAPGVSLAPDRQGRAEAAAQFSAAPDGCLKTDAPVLDTGVSFTVAAWVKLSDGGGTNPAIITQAGDFRPAFYLQWNRSTGRWKFIMPSADQEEVTWRSALGLAPAPVGQWQHVAGVYDAAAGQVRLYVDGVLQEANDAHPTAWQATGPLVVGCSARISGDNWHEGDLTIDEAVAYQGVLTGERIAELTTGGPPAGQVSWWPLRGDGADTGPGGNDLTVPPGVSWVPDSHGRVGGAIQLDGASCAATGGPAVRTDGSFTVAAWARPGDDGTGQLTVLSQGGESVPAMRLLRSAGNQWGFVVTGSDTVAPAEYEAYAPAAATAGGWQHVVGAYDAGAGEIRLYVDGVLLASAAAPQVLWRSGEATYLGCAGVGGGTSDYFDGAVHDVRVWRGAATPEQLQAVAVERVSFWGLDGSGLDAWGSNPLSLVGDHEWVDDRFGFPFSAFGLALDGTGWAETSGPVVRTDESFTVSAWAKLDSKDSARTVLAQRGDQRSSFYIAYQSSLDRWWFGMPSEDANPPEHWHSAHSQAAPVTGQWYHLAGVYDQGASELRLYVNGVLQETVPAPAQPWHVDGGLLVGTAGDTTGNQWAGMVGAVDMVRVYTGVLDPQRIADQGVPPTFGTLIAGYATVEQDGFDSMVAEVPVALAEPVDNQVTVEYESMTLPGGGYAVWPDDFEAVAGTVTFQPGELAKTIPVTVHGDPGQQEDLLAVVEFSDPTNAAVDGDGMGGVWIMAEPGTGVTPVIDAPAGGSQWRAGEQITFSGHADDPGGALPDSALSWQLRQVDCTAGECQTQVLQDWSEVAVGSFTTPELADPVQLELALTADNGASTAETSVQLDPATVELTVDSSPAGLQLTLGGTTGTAPVTRTVVQGAPVGVAASTPQNLAGTTNVFESWSDGGAQTHLVTVPGAATTYTASYGARTSQSCGTDSYGYTCTGGSRSFVATSDVLALSGDDETVEVTLPFPVWLYGEAYQRAWVDTNGVVTFVEPEGSAWEPSAIPSEYAYGVPNAAVYPFWDDWLVDSEAEVRIGLVGSAPQRRYVVEWNNVTAWDDPSIRVSFQVVFHESGQVAFAWDDIDPVPEEQGVEGVVGTENLDGTDALAYSEFAASLAAGQGVLFSPPLPGSVYGVVTDATTGAPLAQAPVTLNPGGLATVTDADGYYEFLGVPVGTHAVVAGRADGACAGPDAAAVVELASGGSAAVDVQVGSGRDAFGNRCTEAPEAFLPTTDELVSFGYYGSEQVDLPFPVRFYGQSYETAWVDIDGVVNFQEAGPFDGVSPIPSAPDWGRPNAAIYPFWSDWIVDTDASIRTGLVGAASERKFVIEWRDVWSWDWTAQVSFQVVLHETGEITLAYDGIDPSLRDRGLEGVIGIENADGTAALVYSQFAPVLVDGGGVRFTPANLALGATEVAGNTDDVTSHDVTASGRYVRLDVLVPDSAGGDTASIYEFEVLGEVSQ